MSNISITDLPIELLIEIFKRVDDQRSLKAAALVRELWKTTIESSCSWSVVTFLCKESWEFLITTNRKINQIEVRHFNDERIEDAISVLNRHGSRVVHFTLMNCKLNESKFSEMLKLLSNLEELVLLWTEGWPIGKSNVPSADDMPNMVKLKTLQLIESDYCFVTYLRHSELRTIKIRNDEFEKEPVVDLLRSQHHLKRLSLHFDDSYDFFDENMPFQLTHLALHEIDNSSNGYRNLLKFMTTQIRTIKALVLKPYSKHSIPDFVSKLVFSNIENLKYIWLDVGNLPQNMTFYKQMESNGTIENLILEDFGDSYPTWLTDFNITELTLHDFYFETDVALMARNLVELKKLSVVSCDTIAGLQFPKLNCLTIGKFDHRSFKLWEQFIKANSQITELNIHLLHAFEMKASDFVQQTTTILKLHALRISDHFKVDEYFFDIVRKNCSNLKILDLPRSCLQGCFTPELNDITGLRFHDHSLKFHSNELDFFYYDGIDVNYSDKYLVLSKHSNSDEYSDSLQDSVEAIDAMLMLN